MSETGAVSTTTQAVNAGLGDHLFGTFDDQDRVVLNGLLLSLKDAGLPVGPREQLTVAALVSELAINATEPLSLADLGPHLAPVIARSPEERDTFFRVFNSLVPQWVPEAGFTAPEGQPEFESSSPVVKKRGRFWLIVAGIAVMIAAFIGLALYAYFQATQARATQEQAQAQLLEVIERGAPEDTTGDINALQLNDLTRLPEIVVESPYYSAPTLEEIGQQLALTGEIGWSAEAYTQRLHELTGLPRRTPISLTLEIGSEGSIPITAKLMVAIELIERPDQYYSISSTANRITSERESMGDFLGFDSIHPSTLAESIAFRWNEDVSLDGKADYIEYARTLLIEDPGRRVFGSPDMLGRLTDELIERAYAVSADPRVHRIWSDAPWLQSRDQDIGAKAPWWPLILAAGLPLLGALIWLLNARQRNKAYLRRRRPEFPPLHMELLAEAEMEITSNHTVFHKAAQRLSQRTPAPTNRLNVPQTIQATIAGGGVLVQPVFEDVRAQPEYLVLIEKRAGGDHEYERLKAMVKRLSPMIALDIYSYQIEPSILQADETGKIEIIDRVIARHAEHRLIILGTGEGFLNPETREPVASAEKLMRIERRALLTPLPIAEWAQEEVSLASELEMPIGRATSDGIAELAALLRLDGNEDGELLKPEGDGRARPLPDVLRLRGSDYFFELPPGDDEDHSTAQLIQDLRNYLDGPSFEWLCALAVYPAIQWDLTLYLGISLSDKDQAGAKLYREDRLAAIAQLPWFREGEMPNWLRRALIECLSDDTEANVRKAIQTLLENARSRETPDENRQVWFRISEEPLKDPLSPDELFEDEVLLDFMARGDVEDFELENDAISQTNEDKRRTRRTFPLGPIIAAGYAVAAYYVTPKPWEGALTTGAWLPLFALILGGLFALAAYFPKQAYVTVRDTLERSVPYALVLAVGLTVIQFNLLPVIDTRGVVDVSAFFLVFILAALATSWLTERLGLHMPRSEGLLIWEIEVAIGGAITALIALIILALPHPFNQLGGYIIASVIVFVLGALSTRYAPETIEMNGAKSKPGDGDLTRLARRTFLSGPAFPALALAVAFTGFDAKVPTGHAGAEVPPEQIMVTSPDGQYFATGNTLGEINVFASDQPTEPLAVFNVGSDFSILSQVDGTVQRNLDPITFMALQVVPREVREAPSGFYIEDEAQNVWVDGLEGEVVLAVRTANQNLLQFFDVENERSFKSTELESDSFGPPITIAPDGNFALAGESRIYQSDQLIFAGGELGSTVGNRILDVADAGVPFAWVAITSNAEIVVAYIFPDGQYLVLDRIPTSLGLRPRSIERVGNQFRVLGEDGRIFVADFVDYNFDADLVDYNFENTRLLPADERYALIGSGAAANASTTAPEPEPEQIEVRYEDTFIPIEYDSPEDAYELQVTGEVELLYEQPSEDSAVLLALQVGSTLTPIAAPEDNSGWLKVRVDAEPTAIEGYVFEPMPPAQRQLDDLSDLEPARSGEAFDADTAPETIEVTPPEEPIELDLTLTLQEEVDEVELKRFQTFTGDYGTEFTVNELAEIYDILEAYGIRDNNLRFTHFMAQVSHETGGFRYTEENLNYSAQALMNVFGRNFSSQGEAAEYARQPERIANRVYANRIGNGDEASGDGWRYRGRGLIQLTGRDNYRSIGEMIGVDLLSDPDQVATDPIMAFRVAAAYWDRQGANELADQDDLATITRRFIGGTNGLESRRQALEEARIIWGGTLPL